MIFQEGNSYMLEIPLTFGEDELDINDVSLVEFMFNDIRKVYGTYSEGQEQITGDVIYNNEDKCFKVPLSQEETFSLNTDILIKYQARVKFNDNSVLGTDIYNGILQESLSKEVL